MLHLQRVEKARYYAPGVDDGSAGPDEIGQLRIAVSEAHTWLLFHRSNKVCIHCSVTWWMLMMVIGLYLRFGMGYS